MHCNFRSHYNWDTKYQLGESRKVLKKATFAALAQTESDTGQRPATAIKCLRESHKYNHDVVREMTKSMNRQISNLGTLSNMGMGKAIDVDSPRFAFGGKSTNFNFETGAAKLLRKNQLIAPNPLAAEGERIVAKRSFYLNPNKNDPKIIKTNNRLYVI